MYMAVRNCTQKYFNDDSITFIFLNVYYKMEWKQNKKKCFSPTRNFEQNKMHWWFMLSDECYNELNIRLWRMKEEEAKYVIIFC